MKKISLFLFSCIVFLNADAQVSPLWVKKVDGVDTPYRMRTDAAGNIFVIGSFEGTADFDPGAGSVVRTSVGQYDVFFAKYDASGNFMWVNTIGTPSGDWGYDIRVDALGYVYVCGSFSEDQPGPPESADFDPGSGVAMLTTRGKTDGFFGKYDSNGNYIWAHQIGGDDLDEVHCISVDALGQVFIGGSCSPGNLDVDPGPAIVAPQPIGGLWDIVLASYDANGNFRWCGNLNSSSSWDYVNDMQIDKTGNLCVVGHFSSVTDFDMSSSVSTLTPNGADAYIAKYDNNGALMWARQVGGVGNDDCKRLAISPIDNSIYVTGNYQLTADFNSVGGGASLTSVGGDDVFFMKYDENGNSSWVKGIGGSTYDVTVDIKLDNCENIYLAGYFGSVALDVDPSSMVNMINNTGGGDGFVAKYNNHGCYLYAMKIGGVGYDYVRSIAINSINFDLLALGSFEQTVDFDPGPGITNATTGVGGSLFFVKYNQFTTVLPDPIHTTTPLDLSICASQKAILSARSNFCVGTHLNWYNVPVGGTNIYTGGTYITPPLTTNTTFYVQDSTCGGLSARVPITVSVTSSGVMSTSGHTMVCSGQSATLTSGGLSSYTWSPSESLNTTTSATVIASPSVTTTYTILGSLGTCTAQATIIVTVTPAPTLTVTPNHITICPSQTITLNVTGATSFTWSNGDVGNTISVSPANTTTYHVIGSVDHCTTSTAVTVSVTSSGIMSINGNKTLCKGQSTTLVADGLSSYTWSPSESLNTTTSATVIATPSVTTTYTIWGSSGTCTAQTMVTVSVNPTPTIIATAASVTICSGQSTTISVVGASSYTWFPSDDLSSPLSATVTVNPMVTTTYNVVGAVGSCTQVAQIIVNVISSPTITIVASSSTVCSGQTVTLTATGATSYTWGTGSMLNPLIVSPVNTSTYTVVGIHDVLCSAQDQFIISVFNYPDISGSEISNVLCHGAATGSITIHTTSNNSYQWSPNFSSTNSATGLPAGIYSCTVSTAPSCSSSASYTITEPDALEGVITTSNTSCGLCNGMAKAMIYGGTGTYQYQWLPGGEIQHEAKELCPSTHTLLVTDANGCLFTSTLNILSSVPFQPTVTAFSREVYQGEAVVMSSGEGVARAWFPNDYLDCDTCRSVMARPVDDVVYCVKVTNHSGCVDTACISVKVKCGEVFIPTAFSPNNDGYNDELGVFGKCLESFVLRVYDRWGEVVFESSNLKGKWDGTYKGYPVNAGVFIYLFSGKLNNGEMVTKKGSFTLVK